MDQSHLIPGHVGIVMDGNGRWAKARGKGRLEGHKQGAQVARNVVEWAKDLGIRQISLYAFSTENWERPKLEVRGLMSLLSILLPKTLPEMMENGVRFRVLGDIAPLPGSARRAVEKAVSATAANKDIDLILCLNYGGQQEILVAVRKALVWANEQENGETALNTLTPEIFRSLMWRRDMAPLDLLIRTGGEQRISNFHLWDAAYAELYFTDVYWPDFSKKDLQEALSDYASRERRYGQTSEQVG
ncbi:polyprenyl diphosphate synthase [Mariprofundus micogutta]|nr:polyprenyl diphosphate synthase [Mariprofundus micogutta]